MIRCPHCGNEVSADDRFCQTCGSPLPDSGEHPNDGIETTPTYAQPSAEPKSGSLVPVFLIVGILLVASIGGVILLSNAIGDNPSSNDRTMDYSWKYGGQDFSYSLTVTNDDYRNMMRSTIDRSGTISSDRYETKDNGVVFGVKDYVVVDNYIKKVAADLKELYKQKFSSEPNKEDMVKFLTAFVQGSMRYDYEEESQGKEYWRFPLETLCSKKGDCEDTSILLAALIDASDAVPAGSAGVLILPGHAMASIDAGVFAAPPSTGAVVRHSDLYGGRDFYVLETATDGTYYDAGLLKDSYEGVYLHLYLGNVTAYYGA